MNKKFLALLLPIFLIGCTTKAVDVSPRQSYRPANSSELWDISGSLNSEFDQIMGTAKRTLHVYINDELAIRGNLTPMATGELTGNYRKHKVNSICASEQKTANWIDVRCTILIDNERAATLTF